jgi:hypothetical protein
MMTSFLAAMFTALAMIVVPPPALSQTLSVAGTLTCTSSQPAQGRADAKLSCSFKSNAGRDRDYTGFIARIGPPDLPEGKRVLVWSVLVRAESDTGALEGTYRGKTGGKPPGVLVGGKDNSTRLEPVSAASQLGDHPIPTVLELRLEATKV